jgi:L-threonylcarbamoyladenylate synthase
MGAASLTERDARDLERCVTGAGVAVFPTDTVYGVCCDPDSETAARRLYELKARPPERPAAVMFFALETALEALPELVEREREAMRRLLPGPVTLLLPNRDRRFAPACRGGSAGGGSLGLRVPSLPETIAALAAVGVPVMQSSANLSGEPDPRTVADVPPELRAGADLVLDGGELPGTPSTVIDLCDYATHATWRVVREGALPLTAVGRLLDIH